MKVVLLLVLTVACTSCLRTRADISNSGGISNTPAPASQEKSYEPSPNLKGASANAPISSSRDMARIQISLQEANSEIRRLRGRIDALEKKTSTQTPEVSLESRLKNYEQALTSLEEEIVQLKANQGAQSSGVSSVKSPSATAKKYTEFDTGEAKFKERQWKDAIAQYQAYRTKYPKGKSYSEATYKIGVCFQELNLKNEAKAFYQEVVQSHPKSRAAKKAGFRLKQL